MVDSATSTALPKPESAKLPDKKIKETKMAKKTARVYALDELKEKSRKALDDPKLVEIVKSALQNKDGKVNCTWAYKEAEKYVHDQTKDLQKTKELAVATRFLAMLRRDHREEFERLVLQKNPPKGTELKRNKMILDVEFMMPRFMEIITKEDNYSGEIHKTIRFTDSDSFSDMLSNMLSEAKQCLLPITKEKETKLIEKLVQLLEEKSGLKVKNCLNCHCGDFTCQDGIGSLVCIYYENSSVRRLKIGCELWTPKEVSEKNEN